MAVALEEKIEAIYQKVKARNPGKTSFIRRSRKCSSPWARCW